MIVQDRRISPEEQEQWRKIEALFQDKYQITKYLGKGGQSQLYCARRLSNGRFYAIKHVEPGNIVDVEENLRIISRLEHPQLPRLYEMKVRGDEAYLVQDYFLGDNLRKVLRDNARMHTRVRWDTAVDWMLSACEPLRYLHLLQPTVLHCDIKPANLLLRASDHRVCLVDFDISREMSEGRVKARAMSMAYASPEQKRFAQLDQRTDIYSLGVSFFQLTTGQLPGERWLHWPLPPRFQDVLDHCMAPDPDVRFQSVEELRAALIRLV